MPEIAWMKPKEAQEEVFDKLAKINDYLESLNWRYKIDESMNFWAGKELVFPKWEYEINAVRYEWVDIGLSPEVIMQVAWKKYKIKATRFLRVVWKKEERDMLKAMSDEYKELKAWIQSDIDDLKPWKIEKVEEKTRWRFRRLFTQWKK